MALDWVIVLFLIVLGIAFLVAEVVFVPGTTVVGIVGFIALVYAVFHAYSVFGMQTGHFVLAGSAIAGVSTVFFSLRSKAWEKFSLNQEHHSRVNEDIPLTLVKGDAGETVSALRPMGTAEIKGVLLEVTSAGGHINRGEPVEVVKVTNNKVYVDRIQLEEEWEEQ